MAEVMLEDTRIHYLDAGPPDADLILLCCTPSRCRRPCGTGSSAGSATGTG
jgi:hypothetical protein